jgi:hypothetical protein
MPGIFSILLLSGRDEHSPESNSFLLRSRFRTAKGKRWALIVDDHNKVIVPGMASIFLMSTASFASPTGTTGIDSPASFVIFHILSDSEHL